MAKVVNRRHANWAALTLDQARRIVRDRARSGRIAYSIAAEDKLISLRTPKAVVERALKKAGEMAGLERARGRDWRVTVYTSFKGHKALGVATIIVCADDKLIVETVDWVK